MTIIDRIKSDSVISKFIEDSCCENGICVSIDEKIESNSYVIIKIDNYYNSQNIESRPPSIDCLIIQLCSNGTISLTLVELKNISSSKGFETKNLIQKFETTLNDFIKNNLGYIMEKLSGKINLYFVSNIEIYKRDYGLKMEVLMNAGIKFNNKKYLIKPKMPTPTVKKCY